MTTVIEDISSTKKRLKIEIPADILEKEYGDSLNKIRQRARIPGFRQGKAPVNIIEKRFGSEIRNELIEKLVPTYYAEAIKEADLAPVTLPKIDTELDLKRNKPLVFSLTVEVRPKIDNLDYASLTVGEIGVSVDDKEVEDTLAGLQNDRAMFEAVDREIREDDLLVIDYVKLDPAGEKELSSAKDQIMNLGNRITPRGIIEGVLNRKKGDTIEIILPDADGKDAGNKLRISVKEVKEKKLPVIDDEFAKDIGYESLDVLKEKIREGILATKQGTAKKQQKARLVDTLVDRHHFEVPESLLDAELQHLLMDDRSGPGKEPESAAEGNDADDMKSQKRPQAIRNVKASIILDEIADREHVTVSEAEVKERISLLAQQLQATPDAVMNLFMTRDGSLDNLRHNIREDKVLDLLLSRAAVVKGE